MVSTQAQLSIDTMSSRLNYDSNRYVSFTSNGHDIHIPYEYSDRSLIEDEAYPRIASEIEQLLEALRGIFGTDYIVPSFQVNRYPIATVDYSDTKYLSWREDFMNEAERNRDYGQRWSRARATSGRESYLLFQIKYMPEGIEIVRVNDFIHSLAGSYMYDRAEEKHTLKSFLALLSRIKKNVDTTITKAKFKPTAQLRSSFISMVVGGEIFKIEEIQKVTGVHMGMALRKNPKLVKLANRGYTAGLLKIFYINDYFPSYADLEEFALLPYNWLGSLLGK
jgi:hypothetical protein